MVIWSQPAKADLRSIHNFIAHDTQEKIDILKTISQNPLNQSSPTVRSNNSKSSGFKSRLGSCPYAPVV